MIKFFFYIVLLSALTNSNVHAAFYQSINYGVERGLSTQFTKTVLQDDKGFIWIATDDGLILFDGDEMQIIRSNLPSRYVKDIHLLPDGRILVATDLGIVAIRFEDHILSFSNFIPGSNFLQEDYLFFPKIIYQRENGEIWLSEPNGVVRIEENFSGFTRFLLPEAHHSMDYTKSFRFFEYNDQLYITSRAGGFFRFNESTQSAELIHHIPNFSNTIDAFVLIGYHMYVGGEQGFFKVDIRDIAGTYTVIRDDIHITALARHHHTNMLYIGRLNQGISRYYYEQNHFEVAPLNEVSIQGLNNLFIDRDHTIWATGDNGVSLLFPSFFGNITLSTSLTHVNFLAALQDELYATYDRGLVRINTNGARYELEQIYQSSSADVLSVAKRENILWIGKSNASLTRLEDNRTQTLRLQNDGQPLLQNIYNLYKDSHGVIWVIQDRTNGLIRLLPDETLEFWGTEHGLNSRILSVAESGQGNLYAVSSNHNSYLYRKSSGANHFENISIPITGITDYFFIHDIAIVEEENYYLATDFGLVHYQNGSSSLVEQDIFPRVSIRALHYDTFGNLWVGTEQGVFVKNDQNVQFFDVSDGLPNNAVSYRGIAEFHNRVWIATHHGLGFVQNPDLLRTTTPTPTIVRLRADGNIMPLQSGTRLGSVSNVEIRYSAQIYPSEHVNYVVQINDNGANLVQDTEGRNSTVLRNLKPGTYNVQIHAQKRGMRLSEPVEFAFIISPPWFRTVWAFLSYLFLGGAFLLFVLKYRTNLQERHKAQAELEDTTDQLRMIIDNLPVVLFSIDRDGFFKAAVGYGLTLIGLGRDEIIGKHYTEVYTEAHILKQLSEALNGKEVRYHRRFEKTTLETKVSPVFNPDNSVKYIIGIAIDVTERVRSEEKLIEAKNIAEEANRAKSTFLANMSHELRTPLNAIIGFAQILRKQEYLTAGDKNYLDIMFQSGNHLLSMINDVLDLSKIEAGKLEVQSSRFNVRLLLEDLQSMLGYRAAEKGLKFELEINESVPDFIISDANKIRQVLINLIGNAIKYTPEGSVLLRVYAHEDDHSTARLQCDVTDTGNGIPENQIDEIFKPFHQIEGGFNEGTGLGLTISRRLADLLQGELGVVSEVGKGSTFYLIVPYTTTSQETGKLKTSNTQIGIKGIKNRDRLDVLIVDDIEANRELLSHMLAFLPELRISVACNGLEAVTHCKQHMPDLIIMDIIMPVMDGIQALQTIKDLPDGHKPVIFAVTAGGLDGTREQMLQYGFDEFIRKPVYEQNLLHAMQDHLDLIWLYVYGSVQTETPDNVDHILRLIKQQPQKWQDDFSEALLLTDFDKASILVTKLQKGTALKEMLSRILEEKKYRVLLTISEKMD